ncbi:hypothetical protein TAL182_PC00277 (plasmid) [Rhizobium sp. TAL182]|nr:hypothetical protein TAL182_PC00277 [Rhizobium sp. TAL182]
MKTMLAAALPQRIQEHFRRGNAHHVSPCLLRCSFGPVLAAPGLKASGRSFARFIPYE